VWQWKSDDTTDSPPNITAENEQNELGFWANVTTYIGRPGHFNCQPFLILEFAESLFYAYRTTGNVTYQDRAWDIFQHITAATETTFGYSAIDNVMEIGGGSLLNDEETFWLAETLKYLFLIFDDPQRLSLDEWVFNTECHPLRRV
jgi:mannosyl-oligosaccharide alpha-1,2-mannosidase